MFIGNFITRIVIIIFLLIHQDYETNKIYFNRLDWLFYGRHNEFDSTHGNKNK
jgi:hypothetical protein